MTRNDWLQQATSQLAAANIGTARLDALVLLEDTLGVSRATLLAEPAEEMTTAHVQKLKKLLKQRALHVPLAYVRGHTEFYNREFVITPAVLEPRPESETMIELLKKLSQDSISSKISKSEAPKWLIADVGTGSGALGITAQIELPEAKIHLLEIDEKALKVAKLNVDKFTLSVSVIQSDLLASADAAYDILLCNLPYVPDDYQINRAALHEPRIAIFGGPDGLDLYRKLFKQIEKRQKQPLFILTESLPAQHEQLARIAHTSNYQLTTTDDFIQVFAHNE